jgi:hypothetical protein
MATCRRTPHRSNWRHCHAIFIATDQSQVHCKHKRWDNFHIRTVRLDIIKVLFIPKPMHYWVVLKSNIKIYIKIV